MDSARLQKDFLLAFFVALIFEFLIIDVAIVAYAFYQVDSHILKIFAFNGFFITPPEAAEGETSFDTYDILKFKKEKYDQDETVR